MRRDETRHSVAYVPAHVTQRQAAKLEGTPRCTLAALNGCLHACSAALECHKALSAAGAEFHILFASVPSKLNPVNYD
jgi:hypothetical protein